ncbi:hypothetical protein AYL99_11044 [Fonsecaea erecta]|uniref:Uncharacterized protein n=1 Tax=Fonsecaea erecta TaxID=1367422 RepID=A0A178Z554_9EURO|nr:hypothetical protein AYL99_11044 [Fonsecaea erecta]OAP54596.1 hypothetical protein AYL99_11044 [Fonsecaea erecta]
MALCALLHQLFSQKPQLIHNALPAWEKNGKKLVKEVAELWRTLLAAAKDDQVHDVTCVLDALDECRLSDRNATDWNIPDNLPTIRLRGEEENDQIHGEIDLVIRMRVAQLAADLRLDGHIKDQLETKLLEMEHRTYLWLHLAIEGIYKTYQSSLRPEEVSIKSLPVSVEDAYEKFLNRISGEQKRNMAIALGIASSTLATSLYKVKLDPIRQERNIRDWCGLFIFINHARIYLIHQTAKEFLIQDKNCTTFSSGWKYCLDPQGIQKEMTRICVEYLYLEDVWPTAETLIRKFQKYRRFDKILEKDNHIQSLLAYSAEHWPSHLREASLPQDDLATFRILGFYQVNSKLCNLWFPIFWQATRPYDDLPGMSAIRLGGLLGHENVLELTLQRKNDYDIDESGRDGRTALIWASEYGHEMIVQTLLERGADINAQGGLYGNALYAASARDHETTVQTLLERGADINAQGGLYGNALQAASTRGHETIVQTLLERGADVNAQGGGYGNALQAASEGGHETIVQTLLERGVDVNAQGGRYGNALQAASEGGHETIVQTLLKRGADVNAQGGGYSNALQAASVGGHETIVQTLLERGADINAQGGLYGNALQAASYRGHETIVQTLLERGADINAQGGLYGNALQAASYRGHETIV